MKLKLLFQLVSRNARVDRLLPSLLRQWIGAVALLVLVHVGLANVVDVFCELLVLNLGVAKQKLLLFVDSTLRLSIILIILIGKQFG